MKLFTIINIVLIIPTQLNADELILFRHRTNKLQLYTVVAIVMLLCCRPIKTQVQQKFHNTDNGRNLCGHKFASLFVIF